MRVAELADMVGAENRALDALVRKLKGDQFRQPVTRERTVKDVLGHIAAYLEVERLALAAGIGRAREQPVYFDDVQTWNQQQYELRRDYTAGRIVGELQENAARYVALVKSLHEEELNKPIRFPWQETGTVHALVVEGVRHRREHREELAAALGQ